MSVGVKALALLLPQTMQSRIRMTKKISGEKRQSVLNLYYTGISEDIIALQLDLDVEEVKVIMDEEKHTTANRALV